MPAYAIGQIRIKEPALWAEYKSQVPATVAPWQGEVLARGSKLAVFSGDTAHTDMVVIRFPDAAALRGWHDSPAYQALVPLRLRAADVLLVGYEGA